MEFTFWTTSNIHSHVYWIFQLSQESFKTFDFPQRPLLTFLVFDVYSQATLNKIPTQSLNSFGNTLITLQTTHKAILHVHQPEDLGILNIFHPGDSFSSARWFTFFNQMIHSHQPDDSCSSNRCFMSFKQVTLFRQTDDSLFTTKGFVNQDNL